MIIVFSINPEGLSREEVHGVAITPEDADVIVGLAESDYPDREIHTRNINANVYYSSNVLD